MLPDPSLARLATRHSFAHHHRHPKAVARVRGDVGWLCRHPDVIEYLHYVGPIGDEGDQAHLATVERA